MTAIYLSQICLDTPGAAYQNLNNGNVLMHLRSRHNITTTIQMGMKVQDLCGSHKFDFSRQLTLCDAGRCGNILVTR